MLILQNGTDEVVVPRFPYKPWKSRRPRSYNKVRCYKYYTTRFFFLLYDRGEEEKKQKTKPFLWVSCGYILVEVASIGDRRNIASTIFRFFFARAIGTRVDRKSKDRDL